MRSRPKRKVKVEIRFKGRVPWWEMYSTEHIKFGMEIEKKTIQRSELPWLQARKGKKRVIVK